MTPTFLFWLAGCGTPRSSPGTDGRSTAPAAPSYSSTCSQTGGQIQGRIQRVRQRAGHTHTHIITVCMDKAHVICNKDYTAMSEALAPCNTKC
uniref:Uncharacterized protein n=1 Tax=Hucho hucho TaxID=62062 RepID=A0A4W5Q1E5_9TELE